MITVETPSRIIPLAYDLGDVVYHRIACERKRGMVTGISIQPDGGFYFVTWSDRLETRHYQIELCSEYETDYEGGS